MAGAAASNTARRGRGWPRSLRHVVFVEPSDRAARGSRGARDGAAGEPPCHLPGGHAELPGVGLGAHDVGGCGGHGERGEGAREAPPRGTVSLRNRLREAPGP